MKNKIFEKMIEYGWNLGNNTNEDFESVYNIHYNFIESLYDYFANYDMNKSINLNDIDQQRLDDMSAFMSDFLRALNDLDNDVVGNAKISLETKGRIPLSMSSLSEDSMSVECELRKCKWNSGKICGLLNYYSDKDIFGTKALYVKDWETQLSQPNKMIFEGIDAFGNIEYLVIERKD